MNRIITMTCIMLMLAAGGLYGEDTVATQNTTTDTPVAASPDSSAQSKKSGNFMYSRADLTTFENKLSLIERTFWTAASMPKTDKTRDDFEKILNDFASLSRSIQTTLVAEKKNGTLNLPQGTMKLTDAWHDLAGRQTYKFDSSKSTSRNIYGHYDKKVKGEYLFWLQARIISNIKHFPKNKDKVVQEKVTDYFMTIKELRADIATVAELNLYDENPLLSETKPKAAHKKK